MTYGWMPESGLKSIVMSSHSARRGTTQRRIIVIGAGIAGQSLAFQLQRSHGCEVLGFLDDDGVQPSGQVPVLGRPSDLLRIIEEYAATEVVVAYSPSWKQSLAECLVSGYDLTITVVPTIYEAMIAKPRLGTVNDVPLITLPTQRRRRLDSRVAKRALDTAVAIIALIVTAPFALLVTLAILLTSPGPVLFGQDRIGRNGRVFRCLKFRSMVTDAEVVTGAVLSCGKSDPRVTPVGRILRATRLDEIPQFLNVLWGDMSVVGPRPERPEFVSQYRRTVLGYEARHRVRPGITGLAQVYGGYQTDVHTKLKYDLMYVYNQSLWMDLRILIRTIGEMVSGAGS
ncbi:MAG TPA: sugar transferase [Armatimonadota bacterium]|jgi:exopolysaccharide biosynthesis polyprenyl glycosylphosphotransferase